MSSFRPWRTHRLDANATSGATTRTDLGKAPAVRVYNASKEPAFIRLGQDSVTATTNDTPVPPGPVEYFRLDLDLTHIAAVTLYVTPGRVD